MSNYRCQTCSLFTDCKTPFLPAQGPTGKVLIVGDAPKPEDDVTGKLFSSKVGQLLKKQILNKLGLTRSQVAFTNVVKCRPKSGRIKKEQLEMCRPFLVQDIVRLQPTKIICLGAEAAKAVLDMSDATIRDLSYQVLYFNPDGRDPIPVVVTYSPAAAFAGKIGILFLVEKHIRDFVNGEMRRVEFPAMEVV